MLESDEKYIQHSVLKNRKRRDHSEGRRCEDNIRIDLREIGWGGLDWMHHLRYRGQFWAVANTVMNHRVP
jgi:hypothetical protein